MPPILELVMILVVVALLAIAFEPQQLIGRARRSLRNRRGADPSLPNRGSVVGVAWTIVATKARATLTTPVSKGAVTGITCSGGTHGAGEAPTTITAVTPLIYDFTFPTNVIATNVMNVPDYDPLFRSESGGYLQGGATVLA